MSKDSKFLSLVLRHAPEEIGITLDTQGWVSVDELLGKMRAVGRDLSRDGLIDIVNTNDKRRFTLSQDGTMIRAAQGHSVKVELALAAGSPPDTLYHGTAQSSLDPIFKEGLKPGGRHQVHLSPDVETARRVGMRHGKPAILRIDTKRMNADGFLFYQADNGVWLTDHVPVDYMKLDPTV